MNAAFLHQMGTTVEKYMTESGRRWIDMRGLFAFMKV
jgi:DNA polymerase alpha subunit A